MCWLTEKLRQEIRQIFEPKYGRSLSDPDVERIAEALTSFLETTLKFRYEQKYGKETQQNPA
jgi:hypothetical protein